MRIRAVIFDLDGTLYKSEEYVRHLAEAMRTVLAELLGVSESEAEGVLQDLRKRFGSIILGLRSLGLSKDEFYARLVERVRPESFIKPDPDIPSLLLELKKSGLKVGCHTNASRRLAEKVLAALGIDPGIFDILVTCDDAEPKPMPDGYVKVLEQLRLKPGEVLYVGDRWRVELEPAKKLGMKTALVALEQRGDPDLVIENVLDLPQKIGSLGDP